MALGAGCASHRLPDAGRCDPPDSAEIEVFQRFERALAPRARVASAVVPTGDWLHDPSDLVAWVGEDGWQAWAERAACPLALDAFLPAESLFDPRRDTVPDEDGWVLLGRVALSADGRHASLPLWGLQQHPSSCCPPLPATWLFQYQKGEKGWQFCGSKSIPGPEHGERLFR